MKTAVLCIVVSVFSVIFLCGFTPVLTEMFDQADLFTNEEEQKLMQQAEQVAVQNETEIVFLTYEDAMGKTTVQYTDDFCDVRVFGYEGTRDGAFVMLAIDLDNREIFVKTGGSAIERISDREIEQILDRVFEAMPEEGDSYYEPALAFIRAAGKALEENESSGNALEENESFFGNAEAWNPAAVVALRLLLSMLIGAIVVGVMMLGRKTGSKVDASVYLNTQPHVVRRSDRFINTTVTKTRINTESRSGFSGGSSHTSSGGRSYGGGGRKF